MIHWLNEHLTIEGVVVLFPIVFMFHDFEEILTVETWIREHRNHLKAKVPKWALRFLEGSLNVNTLHFTKDVFWIFLIISCTTVFTVLFDYYLIYLALLAVFFLHAFTHLGQAIYLKTYTPGVITSIILVLPYSLYTFYRLLSGGIIDTSDLLWSGVSILITGPMLILLLIKSRRSFSE